ncbi:hypothetical protein IAE39_000560 [Pseudomonas sp. S37]|nr:hypothetical protein [Pseudomonas sp. S37]
MDDGTCELVLVMEEGRDMLVNRQMRSLENVWHRALAMRTWLSGPVFRDLERFVMTWNAEMEYLDTPRASRQDGC